MYPGLKKVLVGFGAAGNAGNASARLLLFNATEELARDGMGEIRGDAEDAAHGVCPGFAPTRFDETAGRGNVLLDAALFQLACLLTAERDDCTVELFNFSTLDPPCADGPPLSD